jgi:pimeloyl-ACP methyl ester carboxylesterase
MRGGKARLWAWVVVSVTVVVAVAAGAVFIAYTRDMTAIGERLTDGSQVVETLSGSIEFSSWGEGPTVLAIHGAGGGYDQGRLMVEAFGGTGFRWIAVSRFGYLRTPLPDDASTIAQADAFAHLLDTLGIDRVAILAMSGGVPPALQFALRYPERTSALVLLSSAPYTPLTAAQQDLPVPIWLYQALFSSDFPFWVLQRTLPASLDAMFDVKPELRANLTTNEEAFVSGLADSFQPVTQRIGGLNNEGAAIDPQTRYALEEITAPTLVVHARDDRINPFSFGEYTAEHIPGTEFMPLPSGGHLLLGYMSEVSARANAFLQKHGQTSEQ